MDGYSTQNKSSDILIKPRLLSAREAARYLNMSYKNFWQLLNTGKMDLPAIRIPGTRPKYDIRDLEKLIDESRSTSASAKVLSKIKDDLR